MNLSTTFFVALHHTIVCGEGGNHTFNMQSKKKESYAFL